jgi:hypothetical protein
MEVAAEVDQKAFLVGAAHRHQELHRLATLEVDRTANEIPDTLGRRLGASFTIVARRMAPS